MRRVWLCLACVLLPAVASAQIARGPAGNHGETTTAGSVTFAVDCGSDPNRLLVVGAADHGPSITTVTYATVGLTQVAATTSMKGQLWALQAPATGSNNVVVTIPGGFSGTAAWGQCYTGVNQSVTPDACTSAEDIGVTSQTLTWTTVADNTWAFYVVRNANGVIITADTGASLVGSSQNVADETLTFFDSNAALTPAGSKSVKSNNGVTAANFYGVVCSFAPAGGGGGSTQGRILGGGVFFKVPLRRDPSMFRQGR